MEVSTGHSVTSIVDGCIAISAGSDETQLEAGTILWASGTKASALGAVLAGEKKEEFLDKRQLDIDTEIETVKKRIEEVKAIKEKTESLNEQKLAELEKISKLSTEEARAELIKLVEKH